MIKRVSIGDDITADKFNELVDAFNRLRISGFGGVMVSGNLDSGFTVGVRRSASATAEETASALPHTFDLTTGTAGKLKLIHCYYQLSGKFVFASSQPEFTPAAGVLYAVIDTSVEAGSVTAVMNFIYDPNTPEKFPIGLYILDETGAVVCDLRNSQVVIYG